MQSDWEENRILYDDFVDIYTKRQLTYPSDKLNAFNAVLAALGSGDSGGTLCGLPEICLDAALLWQPFRAHVLVRNSHFASWSWAGWTGPVHCTVASLRPNAKSVDIQHSFQTKRRTPQRQSAPTVQSEVSTHATSGTDVLFFKTEFMAVDHFSFVNLKRSKVWYGEQMAIIYKGQEVGRILSSHEALESAQQELLGQDDFEKSLREFMRLSTATHDSAGPLPAEIVNVMLIGYPREGLAERLAIGQIQKSFWDSEPRTEKEIALG